MWKIPDIRQKKLIVEMKKKNHWGIHMTDDVIILKTSGVPLFAKCYGGSTCKMHPDHALQSGFLAALFSFSKETFSEKGIKSVIFDDFKLDFKVDEGNELIIVLANPILEDDEKIKKQLEDTHKIFIEKYQPQLNNLAYDTSLFMDFDKDLVELKVVPQNAKMDLPLDKIPFWKKIFTRGKKQE